MEQHNQLVESSTVSALKSEVTQLEDKVKREIKQQEMLQEELVKLGAKYICLFIIYILYVLRSLSHSHVRCQIKKPMSSNELTNYCHGQLSQFLNKYR